MSTYHRCLCNHTTSDHGEHGHGQCLIEACTCGAMDPMEEITTPKEFRGTREQNEKAAAERREKLKETNGHTDSD